MRILFISNYFPPEVNAPATRLFEHARHWIREGHEVEVLTSAPNFPEGDVYPGFRNQFATTERDGIKVTRVPMYLSANSGIIRRTLSFISFMVSVRWYIGRLQLEPDVVVATSPQFFAGLAGYLAGRRLRVPFVLEVRDLWPESIVAVGAMKRNVVIRFFERLERFLYREAQHIVVVTDAFKRCIAGNGIDAGKISVIKNAADLEAWSTPLNPERLQELQTRYNLQGKFVASYIGTIGMAHRVDILLEAARRCQDPDVLFLVAGAGAERDRLASMAEVQNLPNFRLLGKIPREEVRYLLALSGCSIVHLKASDLFKTVIPSKIFESMASRTPIVLGVQGESKELVDDAGAGIAVQPENADEIVEAVLRLKNDRDLRARMAEAGYAHVHRYFDRSRLAHRYSVLLQRLISPEAELVSHPINVA